MTDKKLPFDKKEIENIIEKYLKVNKKIVYKSFVFLIF